MQNTNTIIKKLDMYIPAAKIFQVLPSEENANFLDSSLVSSAFKFGRQKTLDDILSIVEGDKTGRDTTYVGIVMEACQPGDFGRPTECTPDTLMFIDSHTNPIPTPTERDPSLELAGFNSSSHRMGSIGIIHAFSRMCTEIFYFITLLAKECH